MKTHFNHHAMSELILPRKVTLWIIVFLRALLPLPAHDLSGLGYDSSVRPPEGVVPGWFDGNTNARMGMSNAADQFTEKKAPALASIFTPFAPWVSTFWDDRFLYVESRGIPEHGMMIGISSWQQQIPVPQEYVGGNSWRLPLNPVPSQSPVSIKGRFLRGAIALAANGVPIFNPQNNRGEISAQIGELDPWGGHCGRGDDYHYHAAPLHLQEIVGKGRPIAVAMDGYPIYGLTEPDGITPQSLDDFHGHWTKELGYHYHASTNYPYVNGGFHGEVTEAGGQVDPQPGARPLRPAGKPLPGATITGFDQTGTNSYKLIYDLHGEKHEILYSLVSNSVLKVEYRNGTAGTNTEIYSPRNGGGGKMQPLESPQEALRTSAPSLAAIPTWSMQLESPAVGADGLLPVAFTGDGAGISPPLAWKAAPEGTKAFALIMHHLDPEGKTKWYWTLYNIPSGVSSLPQNVKGVGTFGCNSVNREIGYAPPHSKGPGPKTYVITLYALSSLLDVKFPAEQVNRDVLLEAMKGRILASSSLNVVYSRTGAVEPDFKKPAADAWMNDLIP